MLSPNVIIPFDGDHADIPAGFTRDTRFDGKYPKGASSNWGSGGGNTTHNHTAAHTHDVASHTHTISTGNATEGAEYAISSSGDIAPRDHSHSTASQAPSSGTCNSDDATFDSESNDPPYYEVIFIKASSYAFIPINGMIFHVGSRDGLTYHSASENKFLKGAGTGEDAGGTGGNSSHTHSQTHTHSVNSHTHPGSYVTGASSSYQDGGDSPAQSKGNHQHTVNLYASTQNMSADSTPSGSANLEPYHKTILHYIATAKTLPKRGDIAMTTESDIPVGWLECDGENGTPNLIGFYIKNTQNYGDIDGANTHTHTLSHSHTGSGTHTHTYDALTGQNSVSGGRLSGSAGYSRVGHKHGITSVSSETANYDTSAPTSTEINNEPEYINVRFIQFQFATGGGALFAMA